MIYRETVISVDILREGLFQRRKQAKGVGERSSENSIEIQKRGRN
jgi:hypothetical protein